jgi:hypothetical protein
MSKIPKYFIYHIEGKKIGVTDNPKRRAKQYKLEELVIIETETSAKRAGEREIELQKQYGYPVDKKAYHKVKRMTNKRKKK